MHYVLIKVISSIKNTDESSKIKQTLTLSTVSLTNTVFNAFLQILIVRLFTEEQLAVYMQSVMVYNTLFPFLQMGINSGIFYLLAREEKRQKEIIYNAMMLILVACTVVGAFFFLGGSYFLADKFHNNGIILTSYFLVPYLCFTVLESIVLVCMVFYKRIRFIAYYNIFKTCICVFAMMCTTLLTSNGEVLFACRSLINIFMAVVCIFLAFKYVVPRGQCSFNCKIARKIMEVSFPLCLSVIAGVMYVNLDKWMVSTMFSPKEFAIYQAGAYELPFISMITGAISTVMLVDINNAAKRNDIAEVISIFKAIATKTSLLLMPIMVFFICTGEDFIIFLFTDKYRESVPIFLIYLFYIPIRCILYGPFFVALGKSKIIMYRESTSLVFNAVVSYIAINYIGPIGAALATILIGYVYSVPFYLYLLSKWSKKKWYDILPLRCMLMNVWHFIPAGMVVVLLNRFILLDYSYAVRFSFMIIVYGLLMLAIYKVIYGLSPKKIISMVKG